MKLNEKQITSLLHGDKITVHEEVSPQPTMVDGSWSWLGIQEDDLPWWVNALNGIGPPYKQGQIIPIKEPYFIADYEDTSWMSEGDNLARFRVNNGVTWWEVAEYKATSKQGRQWKKASGMPEWAVRLHGVVGRVSAFQKDKIWYWDVPLIALEKKP